MMKLYEQRSRGWQRTGGVTDDRNTAGGVSRETDEGDEDENEAGCLNTAALRQSWR
jgi:hypothetical protein